MLYLLWNIVTKLLGCGFDICAALVSAAFGVIQPWEPTAGNPLGESHSIYSTLNIQAGLLIFRAAGEGVKGADIAAAVGPRHILQGDGWRGEGGLSEEHFVLEGAVYLLAKPLAVRGQVLNLALFWELLPRDLLHTCDVRAQSVTEANCLHWLLIMQYYTFHPFRKWY